MATSLPPSEALYHMTAKVFQRSAGRSAVAAAAYRSASKLYDDRIGQEFDYRQKAVVESFILAPVDAPAWVQDREQLWNRVEAAEKRKDAVVAREVEISIPRDIPESEWRAFAEAIAQKYVDAGAVVDMAIHCPKDAYGEPQPHIHGMIAPRALDASQPTGFAKSKNAALAAIFESGGRRGGEKGDALKNERARVADTMNEFLAAAGSDRRASHESYVARGIDREPEMKIGEQRMQKVRRQKKHDRQSALVSGIRNTRILENELIQIEEEIMAHAPRYQTPNAPGGINRTRKQDFKKRLLSGRFPDALKDIDRDKLHMIDVKQMGITRIQTRDGGWLEVDHAGRTIRTWGDRGYADRVATVLSASGYADHIEHLEEMQMVGRKGGIIDRHKGEPIPEQDFTKVETLADRWRSRGYDPVEATDGCWIHGKHWKIQDLGNEVRIHGKPDESAIQAMLLKAQDEWGAETEVYGTKEFKDQVWLQAQRMGVTVYDKETGDLYKPSPEIAKAFEADRKKVEEATKNLETVKDQRDIAELLKEAVSGDVAAIAKLENSGESGLTDFATLHLDDKQRTAFAALSAAQIAEGLPAFRQAGIAAREADDARRGEASQAIKLETLSVNDDENDPVPEQKPSAKPNGGKLNLKKMAADDEMDLDAELARQEAMEKAEQDRDYGF